MFSAVTVVVLLCFGPILGLAASNGDIVIYGDYPLAYKDWISIYLQVAPGITTLLREVKWCGIIGDAPRIYACTDQGVSQRMTLYPSNQALVTQVADQPNIVYIDPIAVGGWLNPVHQQWLVVVTVEMIGYDGKKLIQTTHFGMPHTPTTTWSSYYEETTTADTETSTTTTTTGVIITEAPPVLTVRHHSWMAFGLIVGIGAVLLLVVIVLLRTGLVSLGLHAGETPIMLRPEEEEIEMQDL